jgi:hypothetical protein
MKRLSQVALFPCVLILVAGLGRAGGADAPDRTAGRKAYEKLIAKFPEDRQGFGVDTHLGAVDHQPMTYGLVLSAEAIRLKHAPNEDSRRRVTKATAWLLENQDLDGDGKPGWGLPQPWDAWADGTTNPAHQPYTITTAICLDSLLDALAVPELWTDAQRDEIRGLMRKIVLRWCRELWSEGYGGGYFWYSPDPNDEVFGINASVMFLGSMSRLLAEQPGVFSDDERQLVQERADVLARAVVQTVKPREGLPFWKYAPAPNRYNNIQDNDLVHHVYILWGVETYRDCGGRVKLPWTRAQAIASVDCFWRDGRMWALPQDAPAEPGGAISKSPPTLWSVGMALAFYAKWGDPEQGRRTFEAIDRDYGPWPELRLTPKEPKDEGNATFYPRHAAHALLGLAIYAYR